jgi:hypothetical protein
MPLCYPQLRVQGLGTLHPTQPQQSRAEALYESCIHESYYSCCPFLLPVTAICCRCLLQMPVAEAGPVLHRGETSSSANQHWNQVDKPVESSRAAKQSCCFTPPRMQHHTSCCQQLPSVAAACTRASATKGRTQQQTQPTLEQCQTSQSKA